VKNKIKKKKSIRKMKKKIESTEFPSNSRSRSWDYNNLIKSKLKNNYEVQFPINLMFEGEIERKNID
jgi:hypothetical protein